MSGREGVAEPNLAKAWHNLIPIKLSCFVWKLFQNRVSTKVNLYRRGALEQGDIHCVGDCGAEETI